MDAPLIWKEEFGLRLAEFDSDQGGNFAVFFPELHRLKLIRPGIRMLSIGGGFGTLEVAAAKQLGVKLGFIDPSPRLFQLFRDRVRREQVEDQVLEEHLGPFATFQPRHQYDLVIAIHSWYYLGLDAAQLLKALSARAPGGALYIALSSRRDWDFELKLFLHGLSGERPLTQEDLSEWAANLGYPHELRQFEIRKSSEHWVENGELTEVARRTMSYLSRRDWAELPDAIREQARALVLAKAMDQGLDRVGTLVSWGGGLVFSNE